MLNFLGLRELLKYAFTRGLRPTPNGEGHQREARAVINELINKFHQLCIKLGIPDAVAENTKF